MIELKQDDSKYCEITRESLIKDMKEFSGGSSFMNVKQLTDWSGRSRDYVKNLIHPLEWITTSSEMHTKSYFILDVAGAVMDRLEPSDNLTSWLRMRDVNRDPYRDDMIGARARDVTVTMGYSDQVKRDTVALADKVGAKNASELMNVKYGTIGGWRYSRTLEQENGTPGLYAGVGSEATEELFERIAETYGVDIDDLRERRRKFKESRYGYLLKS